MATYPTNPNLPQGVDGTEVNPANWNKFIDNINAIGADLVDGRGDGQTFPGTPHTSGQSNDIDNMLQSIKHMIADITGETNWYDQVDIALATIARTSITFANDDATPSIATAGRPVGMCHTATGNSTALDVTDLDNGSENQIIIVIGGNNTNKTTLKAKSIDPNSDLNLRSDWEEAQGECILLIYDSAAAEWYEISRSPEPGTGGGGDENDLTTSDASASAQTVNLPSAVGRLDEFHAVTKTDSSANTVKVVPTPGTTGFYLRRQHHTVGYLSDGSNWHKVAETGEVLNVKDFGATGDGTTDDTTAIQAAITAATDGDILYFPRGNYYISGELDITDNIAVIGEGVQSQIYQSSTSLNLFHFTCTGHMRVERLRLSGEQTTAGKCLIRCEYPVSHGIIRDIMMRGGYYGIGLFGTLFMELDHVMSTQNSFHAVSATNQAWIFGERSTVSDNGIIIIHPILQAGGTRGIDIRDTNSEGDCVIIGGCIEAMPAGGKGIYMSGMNQGVTIIGTHLEGSNSPIELSACNGVEIIGCMNTNLTISGCRGVAIRACYLNNNPNISSTCQGVIIENCKYQSATGSITNAALNVDQRNVYDVSGDTWGGYGNFMGDTHIRNMCDGDLEAWDDNDQPLGFSGAPVVTCITKETTTVRFGSACAKIIVPAGQTGANIRFDLDTQKFDYTETYMPRFITVRFWAYKPATNGFNPKITHGWTGGSTTGHVFSLSTQVWTPCQQTFRLTNAYANPYILIGRLSGELSEGDYIYVDGITITEGNIAPPTFDDSRGLEGNFRVSGNSLRGGAVSTMSGNETFAYSDGNIFIKDPGGAGRTFNPSGYFPERAELVLINTADGAETITFDSTGLNQAVAQNERGWFVFDGTDWRKIYVGS